MLNKALFGLCSLYTLGITGLVCYYVYTKQLDLSVILCLVLGSAILNLGNFYGYIKNDAFMQKWDEANK